MRGLLAVLGGAVGAAVLAAAAIAQVAPGAPPDADATRQALRQALLQRREAEARSSRLEGEAQAARTAADRSAREAAALAARIQQAEAGIAAAQARGALVERERAELREALGRQQQPLVRLTAALQQFSRRPVMLAVLRPGSVQDVVYLRAVLATAVPRVQSHTEGLRQALVRSRKLRAEAVQAAQVLRAEEAALGQRRAELAGLETRQRLASRQASGTAGREAERALQLGEQARDLDSLLSEIDRTASLRDRLAALPGPLLRPARPDSAIASTPDIAAPQSAPGGRSSAPPIPYILPATGRTLAGFGAPARGGISQGVTLAPRAGAQIVAPAAGRVAFAGPYRGYGRIVIIEHAGGWTSLVTGLARLDVAVGQQLVGGAPLGIAAQIDPAITLELRNGTQAVNPLPFVG